MRLEDSLDEARYSSIPALRDRIESNRRKIERVNGMIGNQRSTEAREYAKVEELNELRTMFEQHMRQCTGPSQREQVRTPSLPQYEYERQPIPVYSGKRNDLPHFSIWFLTGLCRRGSRQH